MSLYRRAARRDENERPIIAALKAIGADVRQLSGSRVPDLLVGFRGKTFLLGVKAPDGPRGGQSRRKRESGDQRPDTWPGGLWVVVTTPGEAVAAVTTLQLIAVQYPSKGGLVSVRYLSKRDWESYP